MDFVCRRYDSVGKIGPLAAFDHPNQKRTVDVTTQAHRCALRGSLYSEIAAISLERAQELVRSTARQGPRFAHTTNFRAGDRITISEQIPLGPIRETCRLIAEPSHPQGKVTIRLDSSR